MEYGVIREQCGVIDDAVTKLDNGMLTLFEHLMRVRQGRFIN